MICNSLIHILFFIIGIVAIIVSIFASDRTINVDKKFNEWDRNIEKYMSNYDKDSDEWMILKHNKDKNMIYQKLTERHPLESSHVNTTEDNTSLGLSKYIDEIIYINLDKYDDRKKNTENEIVKLGISKNTKVSRLPGIRRKNGAIGCYLSHLALLSHAYINNTNILDMEDDFVLDKSREDVLQSFVETSELLNNRWDVIVLGQYVHEWQVLRDDVSNPICKLYDSTTTSGFLVNRLYIPKLIDFFTERLIFILTQPFINNFHIDQIQRDIQSKDMWIGFKEPLGSQRAGESIIGNTFAHNIWKSDDSLKSFKDSGGKSFPIILHPKFKQKRIAICNIATNKYVTFVDSLHKDIHMNFLKGHKLGFFLFTDSTDEFKSVTQFGDKLHVVQVESEKWPYPTLKRYHYMLKAEQELLTYDYIVYVDVDYRVYDTVPESSVFVDGLVAVKHLHEITNDHLDKSSNLFGSPETNNASKACIRPNENMKAYYCGGCQMGSSKAYIQACKTLRSWIDTDLKNNVMPIYHDESMWNRYLIDNPPTLVLNQSYIYPEQCLDINNSCKMCTSLRKHDIKPIMLPIKKDHTFIRS